MLGAGVGCEFFFESLDVGAEYEVIVVDGFSEGGEDIGF